MGESWPDSPLLSSPLLSSPLLSSCLLSSRLLSSCLLSSPLLSSPLSSSLLLSPPIPSSRLLSPPLLSSPLLPSPLVSSPLLSSCLLSSPSSSPPLSSPLLTPPGCVEPSVKGVESTPLVDFFFFLTHTTRPHILKWQNVQDTRHLPPRIITFPRPAACLRRASSFGGAQRFTSPAACSTYTRRRR